MTKKNKILVLSLLALAFSHSALSAPYRNCKPFYLGVELGGSDLHYDKSDLAKGTTSVDDQGLAGRLIAGFDVSQNVGLELGWTLYQNPEFKYHNGVKTDFSQQSLDFLTKLSLPISNEISLYAKAGLALVHRDDAEVVDRNVTIKVTESDDHLRPMLGVGVSYAFNPTLSGNVGYYRTFGTDDLEDADFWGAGITFRIG